MRMFLLGAVGYPLLELLYRRRTHYSMAIAGGLSALLIGRIGRMKASLLPKAILCAAGITGIEALCGLVWNGKHQIWDYRNLPLNWKGQISLPFSVVWGGLSAVLLTIMDKVQTP